MEHNITECVTQNTAYNLSVTNYTCSCKSGFYGTFCEHYIQWTVTLGFAVKCVQTITVAGVFIWFWLRIADLKKTKSLIWNLSMSTLCMTLLANIILICYIWIPSESIHVNESNIWIIAIFVVVLVFSYPVLLLGATGLIDGFWLEALTRKISDKQKLAQNTKKIVITFCVLIVVFAIIGMIIAIVNFQLIWLAYIFILGPLVVGIIGIFVISIIIVCISTKEMNQKNKDKKDWVSKILITICVLWLISLISTFISLAFDTITSRQYMSITSAIVDILECVISFLLMLLSDYKMRSVQRILPEGIVSVDSHDTVMRPNTTTINTSASRFTAKNQTDIAQTMTTSGTS